MLATSRSEQLKLLHGYFDTMILRDLAEHYQIANTGVMRYFVKRIMANLTKPTSINAIYNDIRSQGLKTSKDDLYLWADYVCSIFMFIRISKYDRSLAKERKSFPSDKISYYHGNAECDFVLQREDKVIRLIQVTWSMAEDETREREIKGLLEASSATGCDNLLIITDDEKDTFQISGKRIDVMPAWEWLLGKD